jgi:hypothetical protein
MKRKSSPQPTAAPPGFALGSSFDVSALHDGEMFSDTAGGIHCILGYRARKQPTDLAYYHPSVAARDPDGRASYRFVELRRGTLSQSSFLREDQYYRQITDRWLALPSGTDGYFGVISKEERREDIDATRALFGGTSDDITRVAAALSHVIGRGYHDAVRLPRITFSKTRSNQCDFSGCLIPKEFPYIAFNQSQYAWSHVSLYGFYRLLSFLCYVRAGNPLRAAVLKSDVTEDLLDALIKNAESYGQPLPYPDYLSDG